jgi:hypothetical protein
MGLDMFFYGKWYTFDTQDERNQKIQETMQTLFPSVGSKSATCVETEFMYWRKANAIHKWFVDNLQNGIDECQETYVDPNSLYELKTACETVMKDKSQAKDILPTSEGFFFGSTQYDDYYVEDIEQTFNFLSDFLTKYENKEFDGWSFYYRSSW